MRMASSQHTEAMPGYNTYVSTYLRVIARCRKCVVKPRAVLCVSRRSGNQLRRRVRVSRVHERRNVPRDLLRGGVQREVARLEDMNLSVRNITPVCLGFLEGDGGIVLSP